MSASDAWNTLKRHPIAYCLSPILSWFWVFCIIKMSVCLSLLRCLDASNTLRRPYRLSPIAYCLFCPLSMIWLFFCLSVFLSVCLSAEMSWCLKHLSHSVSEYLYTSTASVCLSIRRCLDVSMTLKRHPITYCLSPHECTVSILSLFTVGQSVCLSIQNFIAWNTPESLVHGMRIGLISQALTHKPHPLMPNKTLRRHSSVCLSHKWWLQFTAVPSHQESSTFITPEISCIYMQSAHCHMTTLAHAHKISTPWCNHK